MKINVNRLKRLLQQILDFRKVESGSMKLKVVKET
jgi:signal transduction histidine kinase